VWDVGKADDVVNEPVTSDVPALILVGEFDPVHPAAAARSIASGLPNATVVELPALAHGTVGADPCADRIMTAFLADPSSPVDTSCVARLGDVPWLLP
jgi:pimeloyl-ACP methyl ester carboxylesterase